MSVLAPKNPTIRRRHVNAHADDEYRACAHVRAPDRHAHAGGCE
jgi:hypothetical protein